MFSVKIFDNNRFFCFVLRCFSYRYFCCSIWFFFSACYRPWFLSHSGKQSIEVRKVIQKLSPQAQVITVQPLTAAQASDVPIYSPVTEI